MTRDERPEGRPSDDPFGTVDPHRVPPGRRAALDLGPDGLPRVLTIEEVAPAWGLGPDEITRRVWEEPASLPVFPATYRSARPTFVAALVAEALEPAVADALLRDVIADRLAQLEADDQEPAA